MNDPYRLLGISPSASDDEVKSSYKNLIREFAGNDAKINEITEAYDLIMNSRRGNSNQNPVFIEVRRQIQSGNFDSADSMLNSINSNMSAEWNFLKGSVYYGKGWLDEAYTYFSKAVELDTNNQEYASAFRHMSESRNGYMNGDPNQTFGEDTGSSGNCNVCGICQGLICADCCCECMGADCIPCC